MHIPKFLYTLAGKIRKEYKRQNPSGIEKLKTKRYRVTRKVKNTYEAAFYMCNGAELIAVRATPVKKSKRAKSSFSHHWICTLKDVRARDVEMWQQNRAYCNVQEFESARKQLKREVKRAIKDSNSKSYYN